MLNFKILENGNLRISVCKGCKREFKQFLKETKRIGTDAQFIDVTEGYWANDWGVHTADQLYQMSSCLVIAGESSTEDDGSITLHGKTWTNIHNYQIIDPLQVILEDGYIDFRFWMEFDNENFGIMEN